MSQRIERVNQLIQREVSHQLRQRYQKKALKITISSVDTSTDLRNARIYFSVLGNSTDIKEAKTFFYEIGRKIQRNVSNNIILKYFPKFEFIYDESLKRGASLIELIDEIVEES
tara:strand:- start:1386 stop:1727 length:342 start_codon:yes stop_codon:yes gene_type:complete